MRRPWPVEADRPCLIIYTSGTTGRPKGAVLTHGGFLIKTAHDFAYCMDVGEEDRLFWLTDLGWLMGPMALTAALFHGATAVVFDGVPNHPGPDRLWSLVERHRISVMGLSPTAVRALMPHGHDPVRAHDLSSLRILGSTGEPWNPEPYRWLFEHAGKTRIPIINYTGGTEISGGILGCFPIAPLKPCAFTGPIPGMAAECFGEDGEPVRGHVGELVITKPWPGMTAGFWRDPARYEETYWSRWPNVWVHGDWAYVDDDGCWFIQGRSDDTLKIAGKRLGPAEVESVLVGHPAVAEAGVIGVPHAVKGEAVVCFVVLRPGHAPSGALRDELSNRVADGAGQGAQAREGPLHARPSEDPKRQDHAPPDPRDAPGPARPATCRRSRTRTPSRRSPRRSDPGRRTPAPRLDGGALGVSRTNRHAIRLRPERPLTRRAHPSARADVRRSPRRGRARRRAAAGSPPRPPCRP